MQPIRIRRLQIGCGSVRMRVMGMLREDVGMGREGVGMVRQVAGMGSVVVQMGREMEMKIGAKVIEEALTLTLTRTLTRTRT